MRSNLAAGADRKWLDLSLAQQAVWLDAKLSGSSAYQLGCWARAAGSLDASAVKQAISLIMARHDALRLRVDDELPRQWLDESVEPPLAIVDLPPGADPDAAFQSHLEERFAGALPLGDCPLFSVEVIGAGAHLNFLLWRFHHLIADSASVAIVVAHWLQTYEALTSGTARELAAPTSYLKTIASDAAYLESATYQKDLAYWTARFDAMPPPLIADLEARPDADTKALPADWKFAGAAFSPFQDAAKAAGTTVQRALLALFALAIGRRYGQSDIVSGVALHRRDLANRYTIGMLAGVIPVRCQFDPFWTLEECVQAFSEQLDRDLRHQRLPVDILSRALGLAGTGRAGLFEAAMSYMPSERAWNDAAIEGLPVVTGEVACKEASPISFRANELSSGDGLEIAVAVNTDFLDAAEAQAILTLLQTACQQFVKQPDTRFENLPTLTHNERASVVVQWNETNSVFETGTLDALFAAQARRTPDAIAVIGREGESLTYAALDEQSTRLARTLAAHGVKPERVVGVRMERSTETVIALLGILKAGGVYLPLDPAYPKERLDYIVYDAGAMLVLEALYDLRGDADLPTLTDPQRLAYIIYTSGTTGQPKGVEVPHTAPVNLAFARRACHDPIGVGDRVLAGISVGFDVSIGQLLLPLLSGAAVVIAGDLKSMGAGEFWELLAQQRVTHINSVPSFLDSILDAAPAPRTLALKRLMLGGEALSGALVSRIHRTLPGVEVVNMYGPTEACIDATFHIATTDDLQAAVLPIGKPLANYRAYVLDSMLEPLGIGVTGELYLGGAGLARGYVNAADLTSERFVADPFSPTAGRLYKTGDRARWRPDGSIEFLGRADQQVKIRGFRVEPGEIAAVLLDHPAVAQAVVVPRAPKPGAPVRLISYIVPRDGNALPEASALRAFLAERLPDYMVPSAFVAIAALPLNRNGKLDEKALPNPDLREGEFVAPRTPNEELVAKLFAEVLGLERCGAADHFFELGGHSLLATSLVSKMRSAGIKLALRAVFEAPTVELLARRIDTSLPAGEAIDAIAPQTRPAEIPLSFPQERIWFVDRLQQDASYNIPVALELNGPLDTAALEWALERIVARHESLRTRLVLHGSAPMQEILAPAAVNLPRIELTENALPSFLAGFAAHRFNLSASLPFEMRLLVLEPQRHVLAMLIHHVAFDGWSAAIFLHEFSTLYNAFAQHQPDPLPPPTLQYADYAIWQRQQKRETDLAFWLEELKGAPPQSELPADALSPAGRPVQSLPLHLTPELHTALLRVARDCGASLFMVLHAAFASLLSRWSGQDDVVIGTVVANRNRTELESVIGCFINTLALRTTFESGESFAALLGRVKHADLSAFAHQDLPFEQLVEALQPERSLQHTPIFQVMFILQNAPAPVGELLGLSVQPLPMEVQAPQFDLTLTLTEQAGGLSGVLEFSTQRFTPATIERFGNHFLRILEAVAQNTALDISHVDLLDPAERALLLNEWSGEDQSFPQTTLDALFAEQVLAQPAAIAVIASDGRQFTYAQLEAESTRLARYLVSQGVGPERVVGVRMERSVETIIAFVAILKAGGVYLPLDPAYPADRLEYMIANSGAMLVLDSIPTEDVAHGLPRQPDANRLAYIIYTSGTTGQPKGVAVPHSSAVNLVFARSAGYDPLGPGDRVFALTSVSFDMSIEQLLFPLLRGATVVVAGDVRTLGAKGFWELLIRERISHIDFVPSFIDSILDAAPPAATIPLKRLMLGGEAVSGALLSRIRHTLPGLEVVNVYGPTETCIDATYHITTESDSAAAVLPIGRPLINYRAYVLDRNLQPVGIGIVGELYVGGASLARGYIQAPELTDQRFIKNPFSSKPDSRLYRTGDRARWRADGAIEFMGRADQQVKIRGFRVEPGEIETELRKQPGIREATVIPQIVSGTARLIAYYCGDSAVEIDTLRKGMANVLPDYMVPAAFVKLDRLPLSPNGKLDRRALPNPDQNAFVARAFEAPIGDIEEKMATLWAELLKLDQVGRHDNFFELGGHSLLAVTLMERMQQQGLSRDIRALFATPTIAGLSAAVTTGSPADLVPTNGILPGSTAITPEMLPLVKLTQPKIDQILAAITGGAANLQDIYPLAPLQEGMFFQHLMTAQGDPYLTPVLLSFDNRPRLDSFLQALNTVVERHDILRSGFVSKGLDEPLQFVLRNVAIPTEELTFAAPQDVSAELLHHFDPRTYRMDLTQAPLLRVAFAPDPTHNRWLLLLLTHHLILDHTSQEILVFELRALMANSQALLPAPLPYRNFIALARSGDTREAQEAFFTQLLSSVEEPTAPFGLLDVQSDGAQIEEGTLALDPTLARQIHEQARALGVTPASIFHLAWAAVLAHVSGKPDVVFGTILFGRMRSGAGADRVVGMFINTLPIRIGLDETGIAAGVVQTHRLLAELLLHEHAPLALAQRCSNVPPPAPLFSALFNYRYSPAETANVEWPGVEMVNASERTSYPLSMAVDDSGSGFVLRSLAHPFAGAERVCRYLQQALKATVDLLEHEPNTPVTNIQVVPRLERHLVLEDWNHTDAKFEQGTLDSVFTAQARRTPSALAVVGIDGVELTYAQLDARSTLLARQLVAQNAGPQLVVGVRMQRSAETIIAMLAIFKAGGVYLPLDPAYPSDRLEYMAKDAGAALILKSIHGLSGEADLPNLNSPSRLAYIIYTSGTTGRPKGVAVPHSAPVNLAFARRACHDPIGPGDRILAAISVGFDVSIGQLLLPLLSGAAVVVADDLKTMSPAQFWAFLSDRQVTHINSVPSFFDSILDSAPPSGTLSLKRLMLGGEALSGALVSRIHRTLPGVQVVNMYGPTEACIDATYHVATDSDLSATVLPIGRPLSNYRAYVLDSRLEPTGVNVTGELYLGGAGLAQGYINSPELTAERFINDPFATTPGAKLYRTGDLARWRADGAIEFLGRVDQQVKIRGFRVEPAEIEAQLRKQPGIREAAVVPHSGRLIAYYCGDEAETDALRTAMSAQLPDYMVPAAFIRLDKLPLSANGKLDRKALPHPDKASFAAHAFEPPIGELEEKMAALWAEVFKLEKVGRHDNFFELGGHSLLAMTLIERMQQQGFASDVRTLFTTPTIAGLAATSAATPLQIPAPENRILPGTQHITPEMLPLVTLSQPQIDKIVATVPGGDGNVKDIYPLAPLQEGILFQHLMTAEGDPYLLPFLMAFDSRHRLDSFTAALRKMAERHDVLRSAMVWKDVDTPLQVVLRQVDVPLEEVPLDFTPGAPEPSVQLLRRFDPSTYRLDLSEAPLLSAICAQDTAANRWLLLMLTHHLILDHASLTIMIGELRALMADPFTVLPPSVPYRNFVTQALQGVSTEEHQAFFSRMLADVDEPTAPFGLLDTQVNTAQITESDLLLDARLSQRLRERARLLGATPAGIFHVAWALVLGFVAGKPDVVFGTILLGRMRSGEGASRSVGMFINTLPVRFVLDRTPLRQAVVDAQTMLAELMAHEHASLTLAQRSSAVPPPAPLFSSLLNYRYTPEDEEQTPWPGVAIIHASGRTNYPVSMAVDDSGSSFTLRALAHRSAGAGRVNQYLQYAIERIVDLLELAPETPLQMLSVIPPDECRLVVEDWNRTASNFATGTLDSLFFRQVQRTPDAIAVVAKDGTPLSYAELDSQSTRLARQLVANGVKPESVVGVRMERSAETVISFLAILKAGAAYLPLDPAYPPDRLDYMAKDAGAVLVLDSIYTLTGDAGLPTLTDSNRLAYIIYTSGTTGKPKGVAVAHTAPVNLAFARRAGHDPLGVGDRVLAAISVGFDVSIGQLLLPLLSGATVVIAGDLKNMGPAEFWAFLAERRITHINSVPSFFDSILDAAPPARSLALKRLMLGGEPLSGALVARIHRALPDTQVVNMYGPTEACIDATFHIATAEDVATPVLPIGRPLANYRAYVLATNLEPAGVGIPGELFLGGAGLARGYVNAPELTAERFIADPFSSEASARLYRTGDRAQWRADGAIQFLGRVDKQIKIRGHRIELGEIEAALLLHPSVARAAVIADKEHTRLLAYVVAHPAKEDPQSQQLRDHLAAHLPEYMIPAAFSLLPALPLTPNGKLDLKALPQIDALRSDAVAFEAPRTFTETALQQIWQSVLNIDRIGIHDNFFVLGGHSLAAMRLINVCNTQFSVSLTLRVLFDFPTIAQFAIAVETNSAGPELHPCLVRLRPGGNKPPLFCIHPAGGHVLGYSALATAIDPEQPLFGIQARGLIPGQPLANSMQEMAADYIDAIHSVQPIGPYQLLGRSSGGILAYEMAQQLQRAGEKVSFLCLLDTALTESRQETYTDDEFMRLMARNIGVDDLLAQNDVPQSPAEMLARAQAAGRLPGIEPAQFERFHAVFKNSVRLYPDYRLQPWTGPFALFRALKRTGEPGDVLPDWSHLVSPGAITIDMPCSHDDFAREQVAPALARELERLLANAAHLQ